MWTIPLSTSIAVSIESDDVNSKKTPSRSLFAIDEHADHVRSVLSGTSFLCMIAF